VLSFKVTHPGVKTSELAQYSSRIAFFHKRYKAFWGIYHSWFSIGGVQVWVRRPLPRREATPALKLS